MTVSFKDPSIECDCRRKTIKRLYASAVIAAVLSLGLFIAAGLTGSKPLLTLGGGFQCATVLLTSIGLKMMPWRWWYVTAFLGILSASIWAISYLQ